MGGQSDQKWLLSNSVHSDGRDNNSFLAAGLFSWRYAATSWREVVSFDVCLESAPPPQILPSTPRAALLQPWIIKLYRPPGAGPRPWNKVEILEAIVRGIESGEESNMVRLPVSTIQQPSQFTVFHLEGRAQVHGHQEFCSAVAAWGDNVCCAGRPRRLRYCQQSLFVESGHLAYHSSCVESEVWQFFRLRIRYEQMPLRDFRNGLDTSAMTGNETT